MGDFCEMPTATKQKGERTVIRLTLPGTLQHRDLVLRAVSSACKLVTSAPHGRDWNAFQNEVVSAVSEAFNNLALHAYAGRRKGRVDLVIRTAPDAIEIEVRDWGKGFNPGDVPAPDLDELPESGLGLFIIQSFMEISYRRGRPRDYNNELIMSRRKHLS